MLYVLSSTVLEFDRGADGELGNLGRKILQKKFESYNKAWLGAVQEEYSQHAYSGVGGMGGGGHGAGADERFYSDKVSDIKSAVERLAWDE
jgi:hypothetical protein